MTAPHAKSASDEIEFTREFAAPREAVFASWAEARQIDRWFSPRGFTTVTQAMDFRPCGNWHYVMTGPDGRTWQNHIRYVEILPTTRMVYDNHGGDPGGPVVFRATITFTSIPGANPRCRVEMRTAFSTPAARVQALRDHRMIEGGKQTLERLGEHLDPMMQSARITERTMSRTFAAPRAQVYRAWVDPEQLRRWWGPRGFTNPVCEIDARVGGAIRIHMRAPDGVIYPMSGTFEALDPPARLVMRCQALDDQEGPRFEIVNTITFTEEGGRTTVSVHARVITASADSAIHLAGMEQGWAGSLERLEALVITGRV